ncbi:hypothetical protein KBY91_15345 [Streptomyces sp. RK23]|uniref:hypothetical protein n=1 Tax=unclassified Streptomyces TaxID=2593676 RepID=UPI001B37110C|nr:MULTISPECIES: hypothetical protein [unclassified Streptomyces]MBQ0969203.1 hypothetical protein [Streptomyces sp. RK74B]MBQ1004784.1 hypothetical protein [Streptomyces sp. RK23]
MRLRKSPAASKDAGPSLSPVNRTDRLLRMVSLVAGVAVTAYSEWQLALLVGIHPAVAPLFPVAVDTYVIAAVRAGRGRDIAASLVVMGGCQVSAHLLSTDSVTATIPLVTAVSLLIPITVWRVHALAAIGKAVVIQRAPKPTVNVSRVGTALWKPAVDKWAPALPAPAVSPVEAALTPRPKVVTALVSPEPEEAAKSPQKPTADEIVRGLYDSLGGRRPKTQHIVDALRQHDLPRSDGTARETRKRVEAAEPELKTLPPA